MKKGISIGIAAMLAFSSYSPSVLAKVENVGSINDSTENAVVVKSLSLENANQYALNSSYMLKELAIQIDRLKKVEEKINRNYKDAKESLDDLREVRDDLWDYYIQSPATPEEQAINRQLIEQIQLLNSNIKSLENTVPQLENQLDDFVYNKKILENNYTQVSETIKFSIMSSFVGLLLSQQQLELMKSTLQVQQTQLNSAKKRYELGLISKKDLDQSTRELKGLKDEMTKLETELSNNKANFALTLGVSNADFTLVEPKIEELSLITQEKPTKELIDNSYNILNTKTELELAEDALEEVDDITGWAREDKDLAQIDIELSKLKIEKDKANLEVAINNLFTQVKNQYQILQDAEDDLNLAKADVKDTQLYYELGLVSKQNYEFSKVKIEQAQINYDNAKYQYYVLQQKVEVLNSGVIITN
ncbi:TolC family protein [Lysinibacillus antri]|uniref:TolC family protein n=1 Tax=Lysinibacillus antri TaxID=2498145 RepID=A0A3S0P4K8_9BACI|nr:TolC family protein [Lysinibacillus antri]RUL49801.1 hypothetical protein EK386_14685 [Lysinibacillus antri]